MIHTAPIIFRKLVFYSSAFISVADCRQSLDQIAVCAYRKFRDFSAQWSGNYVYNNLLKGHFLWLLCRSNCLLHNAKIYLEVNRRRNRKSLLQTLIRERNGSEKSWFLQGNACQGNSSKLQSLTAGVRRTFTGMQS